MPITRITIMVASRPDELLTARFWVRRNPTDSLPRITTSSSPAIRLRHANAHPCFRPPTNEGSDAGRTTYR